MIHYNTSRKVIDLGDFLNVRLIEDETFEKVDFAYNGNDFPEIRFTFSNCIFNDVTFSGNFMSFINFRNCKFSSFKSTVFYMISDFSNCSINRQIFDFACKSFTCCFYQCTFNECLSLSPIGNGELEISYSIITECVFERGIYFRGRIKVLNEQFLANLKKNNVWIGNKRDEINDYKVQNGYIVSA